MKFHLGDIYAIEQEPRWASGVDCREDEMMEKTRF